MKRIATSTAATISHTCLPILCLFSIRKTPLIHTWQTFFSYYTKILPFIKDIFDLKHIQSSNCFLPTDSLYYDYNAEYKTRNYPCNHNFCVLTLSIILYHIDILGGLFIWDVFLIWIIGFLLL